MYKDVIESIMGKDKAQTKFGCPERSEASEGVKIFQSRYKTADM